MTFPARTTSLQMAHRERGLTMMELLVTMFILAALMAGLAQLVATNSQNANATQTLSKIADTGRTAIGLLATDIRRAGYLGGNIDIKNTATMITGTLGVAPNATTCDPTTVAWASMVGQPVFGLNDTNAGYACIDDDYERGDVLTVRYSPVPHVDDVADMQDNRPYLRATMVDGRIFLGKDVANTDNQINDPTVRDYNVTALTYYVGLTGRQCQGRDIPALFRKTVNDSGLPVSEELLAGVEHLQFRYLLGNRYYDANNVPLADWPVVDAIESTVLVRAECPEAGFDINRTFDMGDITYTVAVNERDFRRRIFTTTTQVRNR
jgi:type IV pilus assembly protein PilW